MDGQINIKNNMGYNIIKTTINIIKETILAKNKSLFITLLLKNDWGNKKKNKSKN